MASIFSTAGVEYDKSNVVAGGSQYWFLHKVSDTAGGDASDDWCPAPARIKWALTPSVSNTEVTLEDGEKIVTKTETSYELTITTGQKDKGALYGLAKKAGSNYLQFLLEVNPNAAINSSKRTYLTCIGKLTSPPTIASDADVEYKFNIVKATATVSISLSTGYVGTTVFPNFGATTGTVTQEDDDFFGFAEV